jgi:hypothetical protein
MLAIARELTGAAPDWRRWGELALLVLAADAVTASLAWGLVGLLMK